MNKKADAPTILLFFVALTLAIITIYIFLGVNTNLRVQSEEISLMTSQILFNRLYTEEQSKLLVKETLSRCSSCSEEQLKGKFKEEAKSREYLIQTGNFFGQIRNDKFKLRKLETGKTYTLEIPELFVHAQAGENQIISNFNLCMEFSEEGDFLKNCPQT